MSPPRQSTIAKFAAMAMAIHGSESFFFKSFRRGVFVKFIHQNGQKVKKVAT
jgi:hypothetical protein